MSRYNLIDDICHLQLRANDFDWGGHLNNSVYFQIFEYGRWNWAKVNGINIKDSSLVAMVVNANVNYYKPIEWDPLGCIYIGTSLEKIENYSFYLNQQVSSGDMVFADAIIRLSLFDIRENRSVRVDIEALKNEY